MRVADLDYALDESLIAQAPLSERDAARLLVVERHGASLDHAVVRDLPSLLPPRSLVVVNNTRVLSARLHGAKTGSGGRVELLLLERLDSSDGAGEPQRRQHWLAMGRANKRLSAGQGIVLDDGALSATVLDRHDDGLVEVSLAGADVESSLSRAGQVPLPPYIRRTPNAADRERYQTVFAKNEGAVAAPTAGLHLSRGLIERLERAGHSLTQVTLHVGLGTFAPVKVDDLDEHPMHEERYSVSEETAQALRRARERGRPIVAVGTTVVRTLEAAATGDREVLRAGAGRTRLLIQPPYAFRVVDALLTNFHLPRSTLIALVMAFAGEETTRAAYRIAVQERYRFFSYGDAMLIAGGALQGAGGAS